MNEARSLVISTVALLLSVAAQAQVQSQADFPAAPTERKLAGEPLLERPAYRSGTFQSMFNAGMVGASGEIQMEAPSAGPVSEGTGNVPRGKSPSAHANEMAELFRQACLQNQAQPERVADWALGQRYVAVPVSARAAARQLTQGTESLNVFARDGGESPLLVFSSRPVRCSVVARQSVDMSRLRAQLVRLAIQWSGSPAPRAVTLDDLSDSATGLEGQFTAYRFNNNGQQYTLAMPSKSAGSGAAFFSLQVGNGR